MASPGVDVWPVSFVALVPLVLAVERASFQRAVFEGLLAGLFLYGPGLSWLPDSLNNASSAGVGTAWLGYVTLVAASSGRLCLACVLAWLLLRARVRPVLAFACAFPASELAFPGLVPYTFAASLHVVPSLLQVAEWGGGTLVVLLLGAINARCAELVVCSSWRNRRGGLVAIAGLMGGWAGLGFWLEARTREKIGGSGDPARVLIVQPKISASLKRTRPSEVAGLYRDATRRALGERSVDWIVWGETALASPVSGSELEQTLRLRTQGGFEVPLLTGVSVQGRALYNSAVAFDASGRVCSGCRYDKGRLVPFVETWPALFSGARARRVFESGSSAASLRILEHGIAVGICYEALYAAGFREQVLKAQPDLLVSLASDLWLQSERAKRLHLALIQLRAIEHRKFLIHATQGAASASIDPTGGLEELETEAAADAMVAEVRWLNGRTVWSRIGDLPFWVFCGLVVITAWSSTGKHPWRSWRFIFSAAYTAPRRR